MLKSCDAEESPSREEFENDFISRVASKAPQQSLLRAETAPWWQHRKGRGSHSFGSHFRSVFQTESVCRHVRHEGICELDGQGASSMASGAQRNSDSDLKE